MLEAPLCAGRYMPVTGADDVDDCLLTPRGYFTTQGQSNYSSQPCTPGYYCPLGSTSSTEVPCPERFYLPDYGGASISDCSLCTAGGTDTSVRIDFTFSCTTSTARDTAGFCPNASSTPTLCPPGYFCSTGMSRPEPCRGSLGVAGVGARW